MFKDKIIICKDCGNAFVFSAREQEYFATEGFPHEPVRCPESPCDPYRPVTHTRFTQTRAR